MSDDNLDVDNDSNFGDEHNEKLQHGSTVNADAASVAEKEAVREKLQSDIDAFLASGGQIDVVAPNVLADPPKKPQSNYGGQPI